MSHKFKVPFADMREEDQEDIEEFYSEYERIVNIYIRGFDAPPPIFWKNAKDFYRSKLNTWLSRKCHGEAFKTAYNLYNRNIETTYPSFRGPIYLKKKHFKVSPVESGNVDISITGLGIRRRLEIPVFQEVLNTILDRKNLSIVNGIILNNAVVIRTA